MKNVLPGFLMAVTCLFSCTSTGTNKDVENEKAAVYHPDATTETTPEASTVEAVPAQAVEYDCVFNNDLKGLTTGAIYAFDSSLNFRWIAEREEAEILLNQDTLLLSIGGCTHFNYNATYLSHHKSPADTAFWFAKARWIAKAFFNRESSLKLEQISEKEVMNTNTVHYTTPADTSLTNFYFDGLSLEQQGRRVVMRLGAYYN